MHCNDDIFRENEADRLFESMGVVISFLNKNKMTSLDLKIKIHKTYKMETQPVNHFIATCPPLGSLSQTKQLLPPLPEFQCHLVLPQNTEACK